MELLVLLFVMFIYIYLFLDIVIYRNHFIFSDSKHDYNRLIFFAKRLVEENKLIPRLFDNQPETQIIIDLEKLDFISKDEISIVEGIIMANGYTFYEI
jgi:hypothetical protein